MPNSYRHIDVPSFDELKALAEKSPEDLEALRQKLCKDFIDNAPKERQEKLLAQQSHIDRIIRKGNNPNHTNILLGRELGRQFVRFADSLNKPMEEYKAADVIRFPKTKPTSSDDS